MQETLHISSPPTIPIPFHNPTSPSVSRPKNNLHFPPKSPSISISPIPKPPSVKSPENETPSERTQLQELLLYLDSLGVDSFYCLHSHPPLISSPLSQIKSTVDFLFSIGLTTQDLRRIFPMCPELLSSSPSKTVIPATTFLLREAQVDAADLRHVIHRRPRLLISSVERQLRPTLYFLQGTIGIDNVSKCAPLLSCSVESKFVPRIEYLQKLGFSYTDTVTIFRRFPSLFCYSIKENLKPKFDYFVAEMGRELKELVAFPQYFSFSLENRIKPRHRMCVEKGVCLALPTMLKPPEAKFRDRLEVCCSSSTPDLILELHFLLMEHQKHCSPPFTRTMIFGAPLLKSGAPISSLFQNYFEQALERATDFVAHVYAMVVVSKCVWLEGFEITSDLKLKLVEESMSDFAKQIE